MFRRPPNSPLFPTRRSSDLGARPRIARGTRILGRSLPPGRRSAASRGGSPAGRKQTRSEEHTSELQSHSDLVCRLLLEKKNSDHQAAALPRQVAVAFLRYSI